MPQIQRALISVSNKTGIVKFAKALDFNGIEILSTGGTARTLREAGVSVIEVSAYTGFPEMMDGRLKTIHPRIAGGILGLRNKPDHVAKMQEHGIKPIDLVVVNLYPFEQTVARAGCTVAEAIEQIDIGGPNMVRAAAKNHEFVTVVVDPADYPRVLEDMMSFYEVHPDLRFELAQKAFEHTSKYDAAIAEWMKRHGRRE